ncbi:hypothetical protein J2S49_000051 [Arcanobacterium wilhelmae]|uniref:Peptidyl-prolyl cis-trans isomerase n=1 Tax=Arcanobacterium wilhelmae TaxID=1803177 RepID=A0ABT9N8E8_9ACTO|nr:FKBP-type peptidyl-prolyl cis-trans isomerase [Arcanobacterium wilhelmae]MDP9799975.1 hypothetical protein [Arcanobacterium wilhelmae]WFN91108.1 hypothetical protein P8A24_04475 [Arcanobacterium wilhelmae]
MKREVSRFVLAVVVGVGLGLLFPWRISTAAEITVSGELGAPVTVVSTGNTLPADFSRTERTGDGRAVTAGGQVLFTATSFDLASGALTAAQNSGQIQALPATKEALGQLYSSIVGTKEGSRVVTTFTRSGRTEVVVIDVLPTVASGEPADAGVLAQRFTYANDRDGRPIAKGKSAAGNDLDIQVLRTGKGVQVTGSDVVIGNYRMFDPNGKIIEDTWATDAPARVTMAEVYPGLHDGLLDQRVGSRVALTIPPRLAQGKVAAFVVFDILGVLHPLSGETAK